jgi:radical SAM superfamily enzyme YgiQ (UPF0313 family)
MYRDQKREQASSSMKILLIQPDYPMNHKYNPKAAMLLPPLGLECIAAQVKDIAETRIIDNRLHSLAEISRAVDRFKPDIVGISCSFSLEIYHVNAIAKMVKKHGPITVLGGWHPTLLVDETLASPWIDIIVRSEGEGTFRELVQKASPVGVPGLSYKDKIDGRILHNPDRPLVDMNTLQMPARDLRSFPVRLLRVSHGRHGIEQGLPLQVHVLLDSRLLPAHVPAPGHPAHHARVAPDPENVSFGIFHR